MNMLEPITYAIKLYLFAMLALSIIVRRIPAFTMRGGGTH